MSIARRKLQDEAAKVTAELDSLNLLVPADAAEARTIEGNTVQATARAEELAVELKKQHELEARQAAAVESLRSAVASSTDSRADVEKAEKRKGPAIHVMPGKQHNLRGFGSVDAAANAGRFLQALARGEHRSMGQSSPDFDAKGSELVSSELYAGFIDVLGYASVGLQVASGYQTSSNSIVVPKIGEIEAEWFDELDTITGDEMTTDKVEILLHKMGRTIEISNELVNDSAAVVNLAQTVANRFGLAIAKKIDTVWLQGDVGKGIDGLVSEIAAGNTVTQGVDNDAVDLAELVGKVDARAMNTAWVVSSAGWAHIMKASVVTQSTTIGDRVLPVVMGSPVYKCLGLPAGTLAVYGDFSMSTAVAYKANGLQVAASEHAAFAKDGVLFRGTQRVGIANHDASFVAKLVVDD